MKWVRGGGCEMESVTAKMCCDFGVDMWLLGSSQFVSVYIGMAFSSPKICVTFHVRLLGKVYLGRNIAPERAG